MNTTLNFQPTKFITSAANIRQLPDDTGVEIAFAGRSNAGKSSALNTITRQKALARTSKTPGRTQLINVFEVQPGKRLIDLPGYGYAKVSKTDRTSFMKMIYTYFEKRENMINAFVLVDARHAPLDADIAFMNWMGERGIPFSVIMTKLDKLSSSELKKNKDVYHKRMLQDWEMLPPFFYTSASSKAGREEVLNYIEKCIALANQD